MAYPPRERKTRERIRLIIYWRDFLRTNFAVQYISSSLKKTYLTSWRILMVKTRGDLSHLLFAFLAILERKAVFELEKEKYWKLLFFGGAAHASLFSMKMRLAIRRRSDLIWYSAMNNWMISHLGIASSSASHYIFCGV